jgi:uncharacterized protein (TIGR00255 family)
MNAVASMTGFASASCASPLGAVAVELRAVNSRFLDLSVRIADELRQFEAPLREAIAARVARGKMEARVSLQRDVAAAAPRLNRPALEQLAALAREASAALPGVAPLALRDVLAWPGVVETDQTDAEALRQATFDALGEALDLFNATRQREGASLRAIVLDRCDTIDAILEQLRGRVPDLLAAVERKLVERLNQALAPALTQGGTLTREELADRIRQEVTLYGLRADVEEELKRLATHVTEVRRVLAAGGQVGRRLDFLMQELNREANTLGSKATAIELTNAAVELKLAIEQMREQIQNLE